MEKGFIEKALRYFLGKGFLRSFRETLEMNGKTMERFALESTLAGFFLSMAATAALFTTNTKVLYITMVVVFASLAPTIFNYYLQQYIFERNKKKKETLAPDCLLQASVFPKGTEITRIFKYLSKKDFGPMGKEFSKTLREIEKGSSVKKALERMKKRNKSKAIDRLVSLLEQGYETGADMSETFREAASDLLETNAILLERDASLIIEKYTLLLAGGLIVPGILGLITSLVTGFDLEAFELLSIGNSVETKKALLETAILANKIYLAEYALIASYFVANQESNTKKTILYATFLLPCSLAVYLLASGPT